MKFDQLVKRLKILKDKGYIKNAYFNKENYI